MATNIIEQESTVPLLQSKPKHNGNGALPTRIWVESQKLWHIVGPAIFSRLASYSMLPPDLAELAGKVAALLVPLHFSFAIQFPVQRFLQSQLKTAVIAYVSLVALVVHVLVSWLLVYNLELGLIGTAITTNISWWVLVLGLFFYAVCGGCPLTWPGFSVEAFSGLWEFVKLSAASGIMLCLENWYYRILIVMTGNLENAKLAVDALSSRELRFQFVFFLCSMNLLITPDISNNITQHDDQRLGNDDPICVLRRFRLGAGNGKGARFATMVAVGTSVVIGLFFWIIIITFDTQIALIFTSSQVVLKEVNKLSILLAFTILLNSIQPVLSGVAVGSGWQSYVAYVNLGCYYLIGLPLGIVMGWGFNQGVMGIWAGMIFGGTAIQTLVLCIMTIRCDWDRE
ncbi:Protein DETOXIFICATION 27, partial [Cucurbita argyrosperma subsp. argyrosperma]